MAQATGSAYVEADRTKVMCGVYGPRPAARAAEFSTTGALSCSVRYAPFARERRPATAAARDAAEIEAAALLEQALAPSVRLDLFPKAVVDVYVTVIEDDGGALAAAITCASLALADAGIELYDTVAACSAGLFGGNVVMDCTRAEARSAAGQVVVAHMPSLNETTHVVAAGAFDADQLVEAVGSCIDGCAKLDVVMRACLTAATAKRLKRKAV